MKLSRHRQAILALIIANIIWGAAPPIFKWSLQNIEPFTLAFLRFGIASLLLLPFTFHHLKIEQKDLKPLILLSLLGISFNISLFFWGLKLAPAINAPIIATAGPIFLVLGSFFVLKEPPKKKIIFGTLVGLLGVILIIFRPLFEDGFNPAVLGNLLFIGATLGAVGHTILAKEIIPKYQAVTITFWSFSIGAITFLPFFFWEVKKNGFLTNLATPGITGLLFGIFLSSVLAYFLFHWAIKYLWAQEVGVFAYLDPVVAIILAIPLLGEIPTSTYLLGSILVFLGIFIAEGRFPYHPLHKWKEEN